MSHEHKSSRKSGVRTGLAMIGAAVVLSPLVSVLGMLMPSRENTMMDELPAMLMSIALVGLGVAGAAKLVYSLVAEKRRPSQLPAPDEFDRLGYPRVDNFESHRIVDRSHSVRSTFDTPV